jgi:hypothetical protein
MLCGQKAREYASFIPRKRRRSSSPSQSLSNETKKTSKKPTLFDTLDAKPIASNTVQDNEAFLDKLNADSDSSLSDLSSSEFEDAIPNHLPNRRKVEEDENEEDEMDWEDAMAPDASIATTPAALLSGDLEITLDKAVRTGSAHQPAR